MDFGDILKKWENKKTSKSTTPKSTMETWLKNNEIVDKDVQTQPEQDPGEKRRRLLNAKPDDTLDIHGQTSEQAYLSLDRFFNNAKSNGYKKLRIIHGKGNHSGGEAVLKSMVRKFIEKCSFAGESGFETSANGGKGATWAFLK